MFRELSRFWFSRFEFPSVWFCLLWRPAMSAPSHLFRWVERHRGKAVAPMGESVRRESARREALAASSREVDACARRREEVEAHAKARMEAQKEAERRRQSAAEWTRRIEQQQREEQARRNERLFRNASHDDKAASVERAKSVTLAARETKRKAQLAAERARMQRFNDERKAAARAEKEAQE